MEEWLKKNAKYLSIRAIEQELGCPNTLAPVVKGRRKLPKKWEQPLREFVERLTDKTE